MSRTPIRSPRFVAKVYDPGTRGRAAVWGVYDRLKGSWPVATPELGTVKQDHKTEEAAQAEAERLEKEVNA